MTTRHLITASLLLAGALLAPVSARAEHSAKSPAGETTSPDDGRRVVDLDVDLELGGDGFHLAGRLLAPRGAWSARLDGRLRRHGFTLRGRMQDPDRATTFRFNTDILEWLRSGPTGRSL